MSVVDTLEFDPERVRAQGQADTRPAPGLFTFDWDATKASAQQAYWDTPGRAHDTRNADILTAAAAMTELNGQSMRRYQIIPVGEPGGVPIANEAQFWSDLAQLRRTRPDALTDFAKDRGDYDQKLTARFQQGSADRAQRMSRNGLLGNLAGGVAGSFTDPFNVATLPLGGWGRSAAMRIATEALTQGGIQAAETPLLALERQAQGSELTAKDAAWYVGLGALGGAAFKGLEIGLPKAVSAGGRAIAAGDRAVMERLPLDVQAGIALRRSKPDFAMTPDEAAALHVISRGADVDATNPFAPTYVSLEAHAARIDRTIAEMGQWPQPASVAALAPSRASPAPQGIAPDFDNAWRAIIGNEGGTNRDGSFRTSPAGAIGPAQVMPTTAPHAARLAGLPWDETRYRTDHAYNVALGQAYYREMIRQFDGDPIKAAAAYNAGPGSARKGTGVRGAMERARRAGMPDDWVSFLPAETRGYVANFRRRTGAEPGATIDVGEAAGIDAAAVPRSPDLDAERPVVETAGRDFEIAQDGNSPDLPELRRDMFSSEGEWRAAQAHVDAEALGSIPVQSSRPLSELPQAIAASRADRASAPALAEPVRAPIDVLQRPDGEIRPNVASDVVGDVTLGPIFVAPKGEPGFHVEGLGGGRADDHIRVAVYRDAEGAPKGTLVFPATREGLEFNAENGTGLSVYVDPAHRRQGVATKLYDEAAKVAPWVNRMSGSGDLTPDGAAFSRARRDLVASRAPEPSPAIRDEIEADGGTGPAVADLEAGKAFDNPTGDPVARAADLAWHDAQAAAAARKAPEQLTFDLGDGKGERTIADIEAELKEDGDAIATIEGCLVPGAGAAA